MLKPADRAIEPSSDRDIDQELYRPDAVPFLCRRQQVDGDFYLLAIPES